MDPAITVQSAQEERYVDVIIHPVGCLTIVNHLRMMRVTMSLRVSALLCRVLPVRVRVRVKVSALLCRVLQSN